MNRNPISKRILSVLTASALAAGMTCAPVFADARSSEKITKEETVYVITDSEGQVTEKIVSDHLVNDNKDMVINDSSDLKDIENVKGEEKFQRDGDSLKWNAEGNDIYYQGTTGKDAPISMTVRYFLDGKEISGKNLQGKSGKVRIEIKYENSAVSSGVKVPFVVMTGMMADNETFTDAKIDNGKVIDNGNNTIIVGMAVPGLSDSIGASKELKLGDSVTIEGTAKGFDCEDMMTVATSSIFEDIDTGELDSLDFDDDIDQLDKAGKKLVQGSQQLYEGISYMNENAGSLVTGVNELSKGASSISENTDKALEGSIMLQQGAGQLTNKLGESLAQICSGLDKISNSAGSVEQGLLKINTGISGDNGVRSGLEMAKASDKKAYEHAVEASESAASAVTSAGQMVNDINDLASMLNGMDTDGMTDAQKKIISDAVSDLNDIKSCAESIESDADSASSDAKTAAADAQTAESITGNVIGAVDSIRDSIGSSNTEGTILYGAAAIKSGADGMIQVISESTSTGELAQGLNSLNQGAEQLVSGEKQLKDGAEKLAAGMESLGEGTFRITEGIGKLDAGSKALKDGMSEYYSEGISQIVSLYKDELKGNLDNLKSVIDAGKNYTIFSQKNSSMDSNVKFIYKTKISE